MCLCSGGDLDISPDARICVTTCPFCKKRFILEMVFTTHLLAHINYYHRFSYDDNNYRDQLFMCSLCDYNPYDIHVMSPQWGFFCRFLRLLNFQLWVNTGKSKTRGWLSCQNSSTQNKTGHGKNTAGNRLLILPPFCVILIYVPRLILIHVTCFSLYFVDCGFEKCTLTNFNFQYSPRESIQILDFRSCSQYLGWSYFPMFSSEHQL